MTQEQAMPSTNADVMATNHKSSRNLRYLAAMILLVCGALLGITVLGSVTITTTYTEGNMPINLTIALANGVIAYLVISIHPRHVIGWLLLLICGAFSLYTVSGLDLHLLESNSYPLLANILLWLRVWAWIIPVLVPFILLPLYFPTGKLLSPRWQPIGYLSTVLILLNVVALLLAPSVEILGGFINPYPLLASSNLSDMIIQIIAPPLFILVVIANFLSMFLRFKRADTVEREQLKWFFYPIVVMLAWYPLIFIATFFAVDSAFNQFSRFLGWLLYPAINLSIPVTMGIAILRHQLFDIDLIIRRTLIYAVVSALLALTYFTIVLTAQTFLSGFIPEDNTLLIVASTLAVAALFNPLQQRVQRVIDRLFYRKRYNAEATLDQFSEKIRDAVDAETIEKHVLDTVTTTIQPESISLWVVDSQKLKSAEGKL